ncbi:MAG: carotenoid 1,2-hydratase [Rubrivivax sp.]|nr:carotenoid 1,2-hydratase [Rubrivivax sp.]
MQTTPGEAADTPRRGRVLRFPQDHGAHLGARTEWWYATGWLGREQVPRQAAAQPATRAAAQASTQSPVTGFQVTFFRSRTGLARDNRSRFAARHLLFAHAAVTTLDARGNTRVDGRTDSRTDPQTTGRGVQHRHDQRIARWSGAPGSALGEAALDDGYVRLGNWTLQREAASGAWLANVPARDFTLALRLVPTQPLLLQGEAGFSRKGPADQDASHYYSLPQLDAQTPTGERGRGWLDHEWSEQLLHRDATGWDWIGINLFDGGALTAFVLRRRDGSALWAGGSHRSAAGVLTVFGPADVRFVAGRRWQSPATAAVYPVQWQVQTSAGAFTVNALADAQELDSRSSTGTVYWEGLSELLDAQGQRAGLGYLEMTGYVAPLKIG